MMIKKTSHLIIMRIIFTLLMSILTFFSAYAEEFLPPGTAGTAQRPAGVPDVILVGASKNKTVETIGPHSGITAAETAEPAAVCYQRGASLGIFTTTGYTAEDDSALTYSGTVPKAQHTVAADLSIFPIGTKLMIGDIVYTVEDCGSAVTGNVIDIYYDTDAESSAHGRKTTEVFSVIQ